MGLCRRRRSSSLISCNFARSRFFIVCRNTINRRFAAWLQHMRETQEIEGCRFAFGPVWRGSGQQNAQTLRRRVLSACRVRVNFASRALEFPLKLLRFGSMLEAYHDVIRVLHHDDISMCVAFAPLVRPKSTRMIPVDICEARDGAHPLVAPLLYSASNLPSMSPPAFKPLLDEAGQRAYPQSDTRQTAPARRATRGRKTPQCPRRLSRSRVSDGGRPIGVARVVRTASQWESLRESPGTSSSQMAEPYPRQFTPLDDFLFQGGHA